MMTKAVDLTFSFWNDDTDFVRKAKELSGILVDLKSSKEEAKKIFDNENIIVDDRLLNLAYKIKENL